MATLARYALGSKAPLLERAAEPKRTAMLTAMMRHLEAKAIDEALDLFQVLMATRLLNTAKRRTEKERLSTLPHLEKASRVLARAAKVLLEELPPPLGQARHIRKLIHQPCRHQYPPRPHPLPVLGHHREHLAVPVHLCHPARHHLCRCRHWAEVPVRLPQDKLGGGSMARYSCQLQHTIPSTTLWFGSHFDLINATGRSGESSGPDTTPSDGDSAIFCLRRTSRSNPECT